MPYRNLPFVWRSCHSRWFYSEEMIPKPIIPPTHKVWSPVAVCCPAGAVAPIPVVTHEDRHLLLQQSPVVLCPPLGHLHPFPSLEVCGAEQSLTISPLLSCPHLEAHPRHPLAPAPSSSSLPLSSAAASREEDVLLLRR